MDIKEIRIGNSILCNGVRAKVTDLHTCRFGSKKAFHINVSGISPETGEEMEVGGFADTMQPIPLTEELLKELGFEENKSDLHFDYEKFPKEGLGIFINKIKENLIRVEVWDNVIHRGNMLCQYLHELEQFVFLTCKTDLFHDKEWKENESNI